MRTYLFTLLLLPIAFFCSAQHAYIPIPEDSAIWITQVEDYHEGEGQVPHSYDYQVGLVNGIDTIVNGTRYACYFGDLSSYYLPFPNSECANALTGICFRQDSSLKKVWFVLDKSQLIEKIAYDFSLEVGDTITDPENFWLGPTELSPFKAWVDAVDSVYFPDGTWRYRWHITSDYGFTTLAQATMIEGMDFTTHLWEDPLGEYKGPALYAYDVICFKSKDQWLYEVPNYWGFDCDSLVDQNALTIVARQKELRLPLLYPNPVRVAGELHLSSYAGNSTCMLAVYNILGQKVLNTSIEPGTSIRLAEYGLQQGLYNFIVSDTKNQVIHLQKIWAE